MQPADKPSGDELTSDKPSGDKPPGDEPSGDKPPGDEPPSEAVPQKDVYEKATLRLLELKPLRNRLRPSLFTRYWHDDLVANNVVVVKYDALRSLRALPQTEQGLLHFSFRRIRFGPEHEPLWARWGPTLKSLIFKRCYFSDGDLPAILRRCPELEYLAVLHCGSLPEEDFLGRDLDATALKAALAKLQRLTVNSTLGNAAFAALAHLAPNLQQMEIDGTVTNSSQKVCSAVTSWRTIFNRILDSGDRLHSLTLTHMALDEKTLQQLLDAENLQLTKLEIQGFRSPMADLKWGHSAATVTHLGLPQCKGLDDKALACLCSAFSKLEVLNLRDCVSLTPAGVAHVSKLKHLHDLSLVSCSGLTVAVKSVVWEECPITSLYLLDVTIEETAFEDIATALPRLQRLEVGKIFGNTLTDAAFAWICKLTELVHLVVFGSCLSDKAFAPNPDVGEDALGLKNLKKLKYFRICGHLQEATDKSFKEHFVLPELQHFAVSLCKLITEDGFRALVDNVPHLEILEVVNCYSITDATVEYLVQKLPGLKRLVLKTCSRLTDQSVTAVKAHAGALRVLDVFQCLHISQTALDDLADNHPTLRKIQHNSYAPKRRVSISSLFAPENLSE